MNLYSRFSHSLQETMQRLKLAHLRREIAASLHSFITGVLLAIVLTVWGDYSPDKASSAFNQASMPMLLTALAVTTFFSVCYYIRPRWRKLTAFQQRLSAYTIFLLERVRGAAIALAGALCFFMLWGFSLGSAFTAYFYLLMAEHLTDATMRFKTVPPVKPTDITQILSIIVSETQKNPQSTPTDNTKKL